MNKKEREEREQALYTLSMMHGRVATWKMNRLSFTNITQFLRGDLRILRTGKVIKFPDRRRMSIRSRVKTRNHPNHLAFSFSIGRDPVVLRVTDAIPDRAKLMVIGEELPYFLDFIKPNVAVPAADAPLLPPWEVHVGKGHTGDKYFHEIVVQTTLRDMDRNARLERLRDILAAVGKLNRAAHSTFQVKVFEPNHAENPGYNIGMQRQDISAEVVPEARRLK